MVFSSWEFRRAAHRRLAPGAIPFFQATAIAQVAICDALSKDVAGQAEWLACVILRGGIFVVAQKPIHPPARGSDLLPPWGCA